MFKSGCMKCHLVQSCSDVTFVPLWVALPMPDNYFDIFTKSDKLVFFPIFFFFFFEAHVCVCVCVCVRESGGREKMLATGHWCAFTLDRYVVLGLLLIKEDSCYSDCLLKPALESWSFIKVDSTRPKVIFTCRNVNPLPLYSIGG